MRYGKSFYWQLLPLTDLDQLSNANTLRCNLLLADSYLTSSTSSRYQIHLFERVKHLFFLQQFHYLFRHWCCRVWILPSHHSVRGANVSLPIGCFVKCCSVFLEPGFQEEGHGLHQTNSFLFVISKTRHRLPFYQVFAI